MRKSLCVMCAALGVALCLAGCGKKTEKVPEGFSFALTWNAYGVSSYDSATGKLVKTTDATHPEDYVTEYHLTEQELAQIWQLICGLKPETYPVAYDPAPDWHSEPPETLILTVRRSEGEKTIAARNVAFAPGGIDEKGKNSWIPAGPSKTFSPEPTPGRPCRSMSISMSEGDKVVKQCFYF